MAARTNLSKDPAVNPEWDGESAAEQGGLQVGTAIGTGWMTLHQETPAVIEHPRTPSPPPVAAAAEAGTPQHSRTPSPPPVAADGQIGPLDDGAA